LNSIEAVVKELRENGVGDITSSKLRKMLVKEVVKEYIDVAKQRGIRYVGFTDHLGRYTPPSIYRDLRDILKSTEPGPVEFYVGAEVELLDVSGKIVVDEDYLKGRIDYLIAGLHHYNYFSPPAGDVEEIVEFVFKEIIGAINNPLVDALAHPWTRALKRVAERTGVELRFSDFPEELIYRSFEEAKRRNKPVQIVFRPEWVSSNVDERLAGVETMYRAIVETECPVFYGSDTHSPAGLGGMAKEAYKYFKSLGANLPVWLPVKKWCC